MMDVTIPILSSWMIWFGVLLLIITIFYGIFRWVQADPSRKKETVLPKSTPATEKSLQYQRDELLQLLGKLKKRLVEGTISEDTYKELRAEYQGQLDDIQRKLED